MSMEDNIMLADWIAILVVIAVMALGALLGFGRGLKFFTGGIVGVVISVFVCYCFGGFILQIEIVQELLLKLAALWADVEWLALLPIPLEIIIYYIVLFLVAQLIRILLFKLVIKILEIDNFVFKIINKIGGAALFLCAFALLALFAFQVIYWIGGETAQNFSQQLAGSWLKLDDLFYDNPLIKLVDYIMKNVQLS